ncbi:MAG: hypothetical protein NTY63_05785 [Candidatus Bipolaricaulota bacterium]|nr:hypothetical protein [Candidatus Bipolaricaulota bacterium]
MRRRVSALKWAATCVAVVCSAVAVAGSPTVLSPSLYYLFPAEGVRTDVQTLSQAAQSAGYVVITFSGDTATAFRDSKPAEGDIAALLGEAHVLVLDGDRFLLHSELSGISYSLRPAAKGMELVISTEQDTTVFDALAAIFGELQDLGVLGMNIDLEAAQSFSATSLKGPVAPPGVALDSALYDLVVARDWFSYATDKGVPLSGLRIEVVAELAAGATFPEAFAPYVVSETDRLMKLVLPIDQLVPLAKEGAIGYVRLPLHPVAP